MNSCFGIDAAGAAASEVDEFGTDEGFKNISFGGVLSYRFPSVGAWCLSAVSATPGNASAAP
jgi:hypothetical protein